MNIYVGNLSFKVEEPELSKLFDEYGEVSSVKIITDKYSGRSKGFAFVVMDNDEEAKNAINELNGKEVDSREIVVNEARPRRDNFSR
jgi:RNA recognition motif-containing protein